MNNKMKYTVRLWTLLLAVIAIGGLASCTDSDLIETPNGSVAASYGYMKISFDMPEFDEPSHSRSMNDAAEKMIDADLLSILVFRVAGNTETFYYEAPVSESIVYENNKAQLVVKLVKSKTASERFRVVVIANHDLLGVTLSEGVALSDILQQITYSYPDKWKADADNYTPFPMWGESEAIAVSDPMPVQEISLYRALARIDVGLNFLPGEGGKLDESTFGVGNFKLTEVNVYRTYNKGYVGPLADMASAPFVPSAAVRRSDSSPLVYKINSQTGIDSYTREIYVPEAGVPTDPGNDNMHHIVVGGFYEGSQAVSYYRLDFATETSSTNRSYLPILRNHRYVFNITQVRGPGFANAEAALHSHPTANKLDYDLIVWDETIHKMEVQGKYYFGLDERNITFGHNAGEGVELRYQTNYPLSDNDPIVLSWESQPGGGAATPRFSAVWNSAEKKISVRTETINQTNTILSDVLIVKAGSFMMQVNVNQKYVNYKYTLNCETVKVFGTYKRGVALSPSEHYVTLSLTAEDRSIQGSTYDIRIEDSEGYGISFSAVGVFDFSSIPEGQALRIDNIVLRGSGTLNVPKEVEYFTQQIVSNSSSGSFCQATIWPVAEKLNVVVLAYSDYSGFRISELNRGAGKVVNHPNNFGPNDNSIIKMAGFNYVSSSVDYTLAAGTVAYRWVTGIGNNGKIADIVYIAYNAVFGSATAKLLTDYMDKGGVVVAYIEDPATAGAMANALLNTTTVSAALINAAGSIYPLPAHPRWGYSPSAFEDILREYEGDPILNGPFGDTRDKQWGEDRSQVASLSNLPGNQNLTVYSYGGDIHLNATDLVNGATAKRVTMFKYESENRNMFWCGDGGFMASYEGNPNYPAVLTEFPFRWDSNTLFPIERGIYGTAGAAYTQYPVYNSILFTNTLAWAVERSEALRAKREGGL